MTSSDGRIIASGEIVNLLVDDEITANARLVAQSLQITEGASSGLFLTSDAFGHASWATGPGPLSFTQTNVRFSGPWAADQLANVAFRKLNSVVTVSFPVVLQTATISSQINSSAIPLPDVTWLPNSQVYGNNGSAPPLILDRNVTVDDNGILVAGAALVAWTAGNTQINLDFQPYNNPSHKFTGSGAAGFNADAFTYLT